MHIGWVIPYVNCAIWMDDSGTSTKTITTPSDIETSAIGFLIEMASKFAFLACHSFSSWPCGWKASLAVLRFKYFKKTSHLWLTCGTLPERPGSFFGVNFPSSVNHSGIWCLTCTRNNLQKSFQYNKRFSYFWLKFLKKSPCQNKMSYAKK